jgi:cellulose synthase (UDP-forming)
MRRPLGFIQTPQSFYTPDVFQHNLYAETKVPNEQDYFG